MGVNQINTLLALKVLSYVSGLTANARAVGAVLVDRYNRKTGQCDPGLESIALHLSISARTVIRSVRQLETIGLLRKLRHGGHGNRNQYEPVWSRFQELEAEWRARLRRRRFYASQEVSPSTGQACHVLGDKAVTQTYSNNNLPNETYSGSRPKEEMGSARSPTSRIMAITPRSRNVAEAEAERRWTAALHRFFASQPLTYGDIIAAVTPEIQAAATREELLHRGAGIAYIMRRLKLGDDPTEAVCLPVPTPPPTAAVAEPHGSFHGSCAARVSNRDGSPVTPDFQSLNTPKHEA